MYKIDKARLPTIAMSPFEAFARTLIPGFDINNAQNIDPEILRELRELQAMMDPEIVRDVVDAGEDDVPGEFRE